MPSDTLKAKVQAVNAANEAALHLHPMLLKVLRPFVGKKVIKQTGELTEALKKALPDLPCNGKIHVFCCSYRTYSLDWVVKVSAPIGGDSSGYHAVVYHEATVHMGKVQDHILTEVNEKPPELWAGYTAEEIDAKRAEYKRLQAIADAAKGDIPYAFGEYDRY